MNQVTKSTTELTQGDYKGSAGRQVRMYILDKGMIVCKTEAGHSDIVATSTTGVINVSRVFAAARRGCEAPGALEAAGLACS